MAALYSPAFRKFLKKQSRAFQLVIEDEVYEILKALNPANRKMGTWKASGFTSSSFMGRNAC